MKLYTHMALAAIFMLLVVWSAGMISQPRQSAVQPSQRLSDSQQLVATTESQEFIDRMTKYVANDNGLMKLLDNPRDAFRDLGLPMLKGNKISVTIKDFIADGPPSELSDASCCNVAGDTEPVSPVEGLRIPELSLKQRCFEICWTDEQIGVTKCRTICIGRDRGSPKAAIQALVLFVGNLDKSTFPKAFRAYALSEKGRKRLLSDPAAAMREVGLQVPAGFDVDSSLNIEYPDIMAMMAPSLNVKRSGVEADPITRFVGPKYCWTICITSKQTGKSFCFRVCLSANSTI